VETAESAAQMLREEGHFCEGAAPARSRLTFAESHVGRQLEGLVWDSFIDDVYEGDGRALLAVSPRG
jgi:hypothetical protein